MRPIRLVGAEMLGGQVAFQVVCQPDNDEVLLASCFYANNGHYPLCPNERTE